MIFQINSPNDKANELEQNHQLIQNEVLLLLHDIQSRRVAQKYRISPNSNTFKTEIKKILKKLKDLLPGDSFSIHSL